VRFFVFSCRIACGFCKQTQLKIKFDFQVFIASERNALFDVYHKGKQMEITAKAPRFSQTTLKRMRTPSGSNIGDLGECGSRLYAMEDTSDFLATDEGRKVEEAYGEVIDNEFSIRGIEIHDRLAKVPMLSFEEYSKMGKYVLPANYIDLIRKHDSAEYFVFQATVQRDLSVASWVRRVNEASPHNPLVGFEAVHQDDRRFAGSFEEIGITALPDIAIIGRHKDGTFSTLILDYKSGMGYGKMKTDWSKLSGITEQMAALSVLTAQGHQGTTSVTSGLITPDTISQHMPNPFSTKASPAHLVTLSKRELVNTEKQLAYIVRNAQVISAKIRNAGTEEEREKLFMDNAKVGSACNYCPAVGTCPKLSLGRQERAQEMVAVSQKVMASPAPDSPVAMLLEYAEHKRVASTSKKESTVDEARAAAKELEKEFGKLPDAVRADAVRDLAILQAAVRAQGFNGGMKRGVEFAEALVKAKATQDKLSVKTPMASVTYADAKASSVVADVSLRSVWDVAQEAAGRPSLDDNPFAVAKEAATLTEAVVKGHKAHAGWASFDAYVSAMVALTELSEFRDLLKAAVTNSRALADDPSSSLASRGKAEIGAFNALSMHFRENLAGYEAAIATNGIRFAALGQGMEDCTAVLSEINSVRLGLVKTVFSADKSADRLHAESEKAVEKIAEIAETNGRDTLNFASELIGEKKAVMMDTAFDIRTYEGNPYVFRHVERTVAEALERDPDELEIAL
jgi:hypothetical protein